MSQTVLEVERRQEFKGDTATDRLLRIGGPLESGRGRRQVAAAVISLASLVWIAGLIALGYALPALPWCITLSVTATGAILSSGRRRLPPAPRPVLSADRQPVSFTEAFALTYMAVSVLLSLWIVYHWLYKPPPPVVKRQVIDIELTSLADFKDRQDPLPGTREKPNLRKRQAAAITAHGALSKLPAPRSPAPLSTPDLTLPLKKPLTAVKQLQPVEKNNNKLTREVFIFQPASLAVAKPVPSQVNDRKHSKTDLDSFWQEIQPPEMVEMTDNDGDKSLDVWQPGGHSSGGTGSKSLLAIYLKELNRKIKGRWTPPRGETRKTEILFRLRKSGALDSAKLLRSSGNPEADQAALQAIVDASPFKELPGDYPHNYLDLHYSFNYNVDGLTEINGEQPL